MGSFLFLVFFIFGVETSAFFPSLRMFRDIQWDFSLLSKSWTEKLYALPGLALAAIGFWGWTVRIRKCFLGKVEEAAAPLLALCGAVVFFSVYLWGLAINGVMNWVPITLFFIPGLSEGWR